MDIKKLQRAIVDGLEDVKGQQIVVLDTEHLSPLFERVIIATGTSNRQTRSLAASVRDAVKSQGFPVPRVEGADNGEWIIVDCNAAVVHLMQQSIRDYYNLEEIWGGKPVKMKIGAATTKLVKASSEDAKPARPSKASSSPAKKAVATDGPAQKVAAKKTTKKAASATDVVARKTVAKKAVKVSRAEVAKPKAAPVKKAVLGKGGISRTVGVKVGAKVGVKAATKPVTKTVVARTAPAKKAAVKTVAAKRPIAKKVAVGKAAAGKVAVKKVAVKKVAAKKVTGKKVAR